MKKLIAMITQKYYDVLKLKPIDCTKGIENFQGGKKIMFNRKLKMLIKNLKYLTKVDLSGSPQMKTVISGSDLLISFDRANKKKKL